MESRRRAGDENLRYHNDTMACLREQAGFSFPMADHAFSVMDSYILWLCPTREGLAK
jgi:hypothetical protein